MKGTKTIRVGALATIILFIFAFGIFPLSMFIDERIGEYDRYSVLGFLTMLLLLPLSVVSGFMTLKAWLWRGNRLVEDLKIYKDYSDINDH